MTIVFKKKNSCSLKELKKIIKENYAQTVNDIEIFADNFDIDNVILWDFIGINKNGRIILFKIVENYNDGILYEILKNLIWIKENINLIKKIYHSQEINDSLLPQILIFSQSFPTDFKKILSDFNELNIDLYNFSMLDSDYGEGIIFEQEYLPANSEKPPKDYIKNQRPNNVSNLEELSPEEMLEFLK